MARGKAVQRKIRRLKQGKPARVMDLFAGCGGLSLGFQRAGFNVVAAVENDPHAIASHARNLFRNETDTAIEAHSTPIDIRDREPHDILQSLKIRGNSENAIDVLIGGPPCQAFARVGRAKLREVDEHPEAFLRDSRSNLYLRYLEFVRELAPLGLLMENVPDVMNFGGHNVAEEVCEVLDKIGYTCRYTLLNAAFYGVPQMRERMFLIAFRKELDLPVSFPKPTHWVELPRGYASTRQVAMRVLVKNGYEVDNVSDDDERFYAAAPIPDPDLKPAVTTQDAIDDLPAITLHLAGELTRGARRFDQLLRYRGDVPSSTYGGKMRRWPGFESRHGIYDHVIRCLPRDYPIFEAMQPGDQYPEAFRIAEHLCEQERKRKRFRIGSPEHVALRKKMVPPYDPNKFPNKWRKLEAYLPSRTLTAHIGKDTYSHIHYDSDQARTISVREAARLQSFPDGFAFHGTMNPAFRQIGNSVPPLLAFALAKDMAKRLRSIRRASGSRIASRPRRMSQATTKQVSAR